jgi:hypothetical protein
MADRRFRHSGPDELIGMAGSAAQNDGATEDRCGEKN